MSEADAVESVDTPVTIADIVADCQALGLDAGDTVLVHSSLSSLGWVSGGAQAVVEALQEAVAPDGTVVVPAHSPQYLDPTEWEHPPVPDAWTETIEATRPPFRPDATPSRGVGSIAECLQAFPDAHRSAHPLYSVAARGADAAALTDDHPLDFGLGPASPYGRLYDRGGVVLLLGVGHDVNTSLHLAEHFADIDQKTRERTAPLIQNGERTVASYRDLAVSAEDFAEAGAAFEDSGGCTVGPVGAGTAKLMDQRALVDFAADWFESHRE